MNRDDAIGSMLRALSAVEPGYAASPRNRTSSQTWRMGYKKVVASNSFAKHPKPEGGVYVSNVTIDQLQRWGYGCLDHSRHELVLCTVQMFDSLGLLETVRLPEEMLFNFANAVFGAYNLVPYHNAWHGFNVLQGCYVFCSTMEQGKALPKPAQFAMLISALCHDINHDGVNTAFHVAAESEIALLYNDLSPLENMHTRRAFELMQNDGCDVFASMTPPEKSAARSSIVQMIIGTDMKFHNDKVAKLQSRKAGPFDTWREALMRQMVRPTVETYRNPPDRVVLATLEFAEEIEKLRSAASAIVVTSKEQLASGMDRSFVRADGYFLCVF